MLTVKKIGILRETKIPAEKRVPITPSQAARIKGMYPGIDIVVQPSHHRIFHDEEFSKAGISLQEDLSDCDLLIGIKEVKKEILIHGKSYMFFAHVIKKQLHNRDMFNEILKNKNTLIDFELLTDERGARLVAFGHWAGIVGAYNGLRAWGLKFGQFTLEPAHQLRNMAELCRVLKNIEIAPIKILITGEGRVAGGAIQVMDCLGAKRVEPEEFLTKSHPGVIYCQIGPKYYTRHKSGFDFDYTHFCKYPDQYASNFEPFIKVTDLLITGHFWDPRSPVMIAPEHMRQPEFKIRVIADISCDINGPISCTVRASSIEEPFYDFNLQTGQEEKPFSDNNNVTVMAVDNLPAELPRDSSEAFGNTLLDYILPALTGYGNPEIIQRATIVENGIIAKRFDYLRDYT